MRQKMFNIIEIQFVIGYPGSFVTISFSPQCLAIRKALFREQLSRDIPDLAVGAVMMNMRVMMFYVIMRRCSVMLHRS